MRLRFLLCLLPLLLARSASAQTPEVTASFSIIADMVQQIGGAYVHVRGLVPPDGDPHAYEPTPQDVRTLTGSAAVFVIGRGFEGFLPRMIAASGYQGPVITLSDGIALRSIHENGHTVNDPHIWNNPANGARMAQTITDALVRLVPEHASELRASGAAYAGRLRALDVDARRMFASLPLERRTVITSHDAFAYMGAAYGIRFLAPVGRSSEAEASAGDVAALIDQMRREHVHTVFLENALDPRLAEQIARSGGGRIGGTLYAEALSDVNGPAPTYEKMWAHNLKLISEALHAPDLP